MIVVLAAKNISKKFGGVAALSNVSLELHPGKVNAIVGENGAGKSTLMKIFSGVYAQYDGEILLNGKAVKFSNTKSAEEAGIVFIYQELNLVAQLSIAENIFLGKEIVNALGVLDKKSMNERSIRLLSELNLAINPGTKMAELKIGQQQLVAIARALNADASVIIMDEPTSAISDKEVDNLFSVIRALRTHGKTVVYISHKLNELFTIADRFVVLRDGSMIDSGDMNSVSQDELIQKMTGRKLDMAKMGSRVSDAEELLSVNKINLRHPVLPKRNILRNISFRINKGEVLGLYGLMGAGRTELLETIFGLHAKTASGDIIINKAVKKIETPLQAIDAGIALVPEDRKLQGLTLGHSVRSNISITVLQKIQKWGLMLSGARERRLTTDLITRLSIKASSGNIPVGNLSGGNQQKVLLAKWLATKPRILLLDEPTRGVDINAKNEIHKLIRSLAAAGMGIMISSSELPEILAVSDRVIVICEGELTADVPIEKATEEEILKHAIPGN